MSSRTEHFSFVLYLCPSCRWKEVYVHKSLNLLFVLSGEKPSLSIHRLLQATKTLTSICLGITARSHLNQLPWTTYICCKVHLRTKQVKDISFLGSVVFQILQVYETFWYDKVSANTASSEPKTAKLSYP